MYSQQETVIYIDIVKELIFLCGKSDINQKNEHNFKKNQRACLRIDASLYLLNSLITDTFLGKYK